MADEIIGGGYLYPSKPFNVLNPGGMSADQSIGTIAGVGEGNRQRALQASEGQKNRNASAQSDQMNATLQRDRMAQEAQIAEKQMAQQAEQEARRVALAEKQAADDQAERERANRQADFLFQQKMKADKLLRAKIRPTPKKAPEGFGPTPDGGNLTDLDADGDGFITHEDLIMRHRNINQTSRELNSNIVKMQLAKDLLRGKETEGVADALEQANQVQTGYYTAFTRAAAGLSSIVTSMDVPKPSGAKKPEPLGRYTDPDTGQKFVTYTGESWEPELSEDGLNVSELASHIAMNAHGKMGVAQTEAHMNTLLGALDKYASGDKSQEAVAAGAIQAMKDGGADMDLVSDLMARTMWQAGQMKKGAESMKDAANATEKVDKVAMDSAEGHGARSDRVANMAKALSLVKDKEGNPLVSGFGEGGGILDVYAESYEGGRGKGIDLGKTVKDVFGAILGSNEPAVVIAALRDADLSNDPEVGPVIQGMSPKLKKVIIDAAEYELRQMQRDARNQGLDPTQLFSMYNYNPQADERRLKDLDLQGEGLEMDLERSLAESDQMRAAEMDKLDEETIKGLEAFK
jgi:hypothetical protein